MTTKRTSTIDQRVANISRAGKAAAKKSASASRKLRDAASQMRKASR